MDVSQEAHLPSSLANQPNIDAKDLQGQNVKFRKRNIKYYAS